MPSHVQVDACPICGSPVYAKLVGPHVKELPAPVYTCRCRQVYPERFRAAGQHGYRPGRR